MPRRWSQGNLPVVRQQATPSGLQPLRLPGLTNPVLALEDSVLSNTEIRSQLLTTASDPNQPDRFYKTGSLRRRSAPNVGRSDKLQLPPVAKHVPLVLAHLRSLHVARGSSIGMQLPEDSNEGLDAARPRARPSLLEVSFLHELEKSTVDHNLSGPVAFAFALIAKCGNLEEAWERFDLNKSGKVSICQWDSALRMMHLDTVRVCGAPGNELFSWLSHGSHVTHDVWTSFFKPLIENPKTSSALQEALKQFESTCEEDRQRNGGQRGERAHRDKSRLSGHAPLSLQEAIDNEARMSKDELAELEIQASAESLQLEEELKEHNLAGVHALVYILSAKFGSLGKAFRWFNSNGSGRLSHNDWDTGIRVMRVDLERVSGRTPQAFYKLMHGAGHVITLSNWSDFFQRAMETAPSGFADILAGAAGSAGASLGERARLKKEQLRHAQAAQSSGEAIQTARDREGEQGKARQIRQGDGQVDKERRRFKEDESRRGKVNGKRVDSIQGEMGKAGQIRQGDGQVDEERRRFKQDESRRGKVNDNRVDGVEGEMGKSGQIRQGDGQIEEERCRFKEDECRRGKVDGKAAEGREGETDRAGQNRDRDGQIQKRRASFKQYESSRGKEKSKTAEDIEGEAGKAGQVRERDGHIQEKRCTFKGDESSRETVDGKSREGCAEGKIILSSERLAIHAKLGKLSEEELSFREQIRSELSQLEFGKSADFSSAQNTNLDERKFLIIEEVALELSLFAHVLKGGHRWSDGSTEPDGITVFNLGDFPQEALQKLRAIELYSSFQFPSHLSDIHRRIVHLIGRSVGLWTKSEGHPRCVIAFNVGDFAADVREQLRELKPGQSKAYPSNLTLTQKKLVHMIAAELELASFSVGVGDAQHVEVFNLTSFEHDVWTDLDNLKSGEKKTFGKDLGRAERKIVHCIAGSLGLSHVSAGVGDQRQVIAGNLNNFRTWVRDELEKLEVGSTKAFEVGLSGLQRKIVHENATEFGMSSFSQGTGSERFVSVIRTEEIGDFTACMSRQVSGGSESGDEDEDSEDADNWRRIFEDFASRHHAGERIFNPADLSDFVEDFRDIVPQKKALQFASGS